MTGRQGSGAEAYPEGHKRLFIRAFLLASPQMRNDFLWALALLVLPAVAADIPVRSKLRQARRSGLWPSHSTYRDLPGTGMSAGRAGGNIELRPFATLCSPQALLINTPRR